MEKRAVLIGVLIAMVFIVPHLRADTVTNITIPNTAPYMTAIIPNQTWAINTNLTDAFDLDNYFADAEETLSYSSSSVENILVLINVSNNRVSFYPDAGFSGIRNVTFTASDGSNSSQSNLVTLNVTTDTLPPLWSNPAKSRETIYQSDTVNFTTTWDDDITLSYFIFSINQAGTWVNQTPQSMSGRTNVSQERFQISAAAGTNVLWRFFGFDAAGNMNATSVQSFTVNALTASPSGPGPSPSSSSSDSSSSNKKPERKIEIKQPEIANFSVDPASIKVFIKQGESATRFIKISGTRGGILDMTLHAEGVNEFVKFDQTAFNISRGQSKTIALEVTANRRTIPEVYQGSIVIESESEIRRIPILIEVKQLDVEFDIEASVLEEYRKVNPGEVVKANVTFTNLKDIERKQVTIYNAIKDLQGNVIDSVQQDIPLTNLIVLEMNLTVPVYAQEGEYVWYSRAVSDKLIAIDSDVFMVGERFEVASFIIGNWIFLLIILVSIIATMATFRYQRSRARVRVLNLYMMLNELRTLLRENKIEDAIQVYVRIKRAYGEPIADTTLENKENIKEEMKKLADRLNKEASAAEALIASKPQPSSQTPAPATQPPSQPSETAGTNPPAQQPQSPPQTETVAQDSKAPEQKEESKKKTAHAKTASKAKKPAKRSTHAKAKKKGK